jgi:hypothetical protein
VQPTDKNEETNQRNVTPVIEFNTDQSNEAKQQIWINRMTTSFRCPNMAQTVAATQLDLDSQGNSTNHRSDNPVF